MKKEQKLSYSFLAKLARSFDISSDYHIKKLDEYSTVPLEILSDDELELLYDIKIDSGLSEFKKFIDPQKGKKLLDIGCYLNLIFYKYHKWNSTYYGIDISENVVSELKKYIARNKLAVGDVKCASVDNIPFKDSFFNYICCINVFEYFTKKYSIIALDEIYRVLKPHGKFVVDIPNPDHKCFKLMLKIEKYFKRENKFVFGAAVFEKMIANKFDISIKNDESLMIKYFLIKK